MDYSIRWLVRQQTKSTETRESGYSLFIKELRDEHVDLWLATGEARRGGEK